MEIVKDIQQLKLLIITAQTPYGKKEAFILEEILHLKEIGIQIHIIPRNPPSIRFHRSTNEIASSVIRLPLINISMIIAFLYTLLINRKLQIITSRVIFSSSNLITALKNFIILPKSVFILKYVSILNINHIHVHWGTTTATMAYVISYLTDIPWSLTLHRHDIGANNLLKHKCESARFIRCTSQDAFAELQQKVGREYDSKIKIIYTGVVIPDTAQYRKAKNNFNIIVCPAFFENKKGHKYLIDACKILISDGYKKFRCFLIGEGHEKNFLIRYINKLSLKKFIKLVETLQHEDLINLYASGLVSLVALPSIIENSGEREGIPVSLIEAMAYHIPVVSTNTGGIPELLKNNAGILVNQKDPECLASAMKLLWTDFEHIKKIAFNGYETVSKNFNINQTSKSLLLSIINNHY